ncbi:Acyl-CoA N-acyltransferase protein [Melia azedarach]|uniref:Acyl-CoA N-acyltransferase protein n=1 Tax=Melia azedarach TaxID=155640 RepID=A0ACC1XDT6_MELAZ|nr:Acyl-CoA N-acyltransferase protein [Melia azedarach]
MAVLTSSISCSTTATSLNSERYGKFDNLCRRFSTLSLFSRFYLRPGTALYVCTPPHQESLSIDKSSLIVDEKTSEDQLWAAACLRVRSFYEFDPNSYGVQDHKKYLAEREFEALKERVAGKRTGFRRVSCINATLPLSQLSNVSDDLCAECKFAGDREDRVVVGTLDLNQCLRLPDEMTGKKPEGIGADFARAYLSNVCVAKELHRNGLGYEIVAKSKIVAQGWGISDLYVHVAVDNEPAKNLYMKSGFIHENDEPAWQARFLDRPRRILLWIGLPGTHDL